MKAQEGRLTHTDNRYSPCVGFWTLAPDKSNDKCIEGLPCCIIRGFKRWLLAFKGRQGAALSFSRMRLQHTHTHTNGGCYTRASNTMDDKRELGLPVGWHKIYYRFRSVDPTVVSQKSSQSNQYLAGGGRETLPHRRTISINYVYRVKSISLFPSRLHSHTYMYLLIWCK